MIRRVLMLHLACVTLACCSCPAVLAYTWWAGVTAPMTSDQLFDAVKYGPNDEAAVGLATDKILEVIRDIRGHEHRTDRIGSLARSAIIRIEAAVR
jgi:hypothetical protein